MTVPGDFKAGRALRRRFERGTPNEALTWNSARVRSKLMFAWQCAVVAKFKGSGQTLSVAWLLFSLCQKEGYAYATDAYIGRALGVQVNHVQAALSALEKAGAIVRASSFVHGKPQRRIWPAAKIIPPISGGMDTPDIRTEDTPHIRGTDSIRNQRTSKSVRISSTAEAARRDAERCDQLRLSRADGDEQQ
ncbi:hypothetical protein [Bradyrhizobium diazoefficiens]|uniref:hypothetical protein n=1 Tax=Bradyrhizobium diazoefficiens TaxID=1355477 RepID=UPI000BE853D1|nr:hypothetical protein [Bradyrhizobium diazoefficiens]PDT56212.1 hypothetical protein CO678_39510 [Bradyrhizobium diazoefficiens]WLB40508.1 hypothetical protein QIH78_12225 [Bradyrhizobium diazoefficiens]WLC14514.1 hypothetical protein QIH76_30805 [Bradyrhizobium diazoefficiens]